MTLSSQKGKENSSIPWENLQTINPKEEEEEMADWVKKEILLLTKVWNFLCKIIEKE